MKITIIRMKLKNENMPVNSIINDTIATINIVIQLINCEEKTIGFIYYRHGYCYMASDFFIILY